jgi:hypothetical protein
MTDLEQMKAKWAEQDRQLGESIRLNRQLLGAIQLEGGRRRVRRVLGFTGIHAAAWGVCIVALGEFLYAHIGMARFALAAAALDVYAMGFLIALIRQMATGGRIGWGQPVASVQKRLEALRRVRVRTTQWAVLAGVVVWPAFAIVAAQALFGMDVYGMFGARWVAANALFGLVVAAAVWRFGGARIADDLAGRSLNEAGQFLARLAEFELE